MMALRAMFLTSTAAGLLAASPALAQDQSTTVTTGAAAENQVENGDIIVTAQKRSQSVRDVPIAITVVDQSQLERQQITSVTDLKRVAPALEFGAPGQSPGGGAFIRGLGTTITASSGEPSTSLVIDGVPQGNIPLLNLFDVARVEVLRGPQGTLFGQSVSAGVINITTTAPKIGEFSGMYRTEVSGDDFAGSRYGRWINQLSLNVPLGDQAALRLAGHYDNVNGLNRNVLLGKDGDNDDFGLRARLLVQPNDAVTINLAAEYNRTVANNTPFFSYRESNNPTLLRVLANCGVAIGPKNADTCTPTPDFVREDLYGFSGQIDLDLGGLTLTSISAYRASDNTAQRTIDHLPTSSPSVPFANIKFGPTPRNQELYSQELRLTSPTGNMVEWVAGGFYSHFSQKYDYTSALSLFFLPAPVVTRYIQTPSTESVAGFGQATIHLAGSLRAIVGGRLTRNTVSATNYIPTTGRVFSARRGVTDFSWRLGGQYDVAPRQTLYATVSEGFKGQTFNDTSTPAAIPIYIKPEIPTAYELGLKGSLFAGKWGYDLNAFLVDVKNYQAQICQASATAGQVCTPQNIDKVRSKGVEVSAFGELFEGLTFNAGVAYTHAVYPAGYRGTDGGNLGGQQLINSPRWKASLAGQYQVPVTGALNFFVGSDGTYRSRVRYDTTSTERVTFRPHWIVGSRVGLRSADDRFEFAIFAKNLFDVREPVLLFDSPIGQAAATATTPAYYTTAQIVSENSFRLVGVSAQFRF
ncbi:TonB-dependent receptor [Sphingomonas adhaesiva]|uniref:TonB-dependent receptor n=1 Tax=Sphingomonas adhaesiva TaxID=28212 RepID=UPI002FF911CC